MNVGVNKEQSSSLFSQLYDKWILSHPIKVLVCLFLALAFFIYQAQFFKVDASADSLVLEGDEDLEFFREAMKRYGSNASLIVAYQVEDDLLADETLGIISSLVSELEQIKGVDSVLSMLDVPLLYSPKLSVSDLGNIRTLRDKGVDKSLAAKEFKESPIYREMLSSLDGDTAAMQINLASDEKLQGLLEKRESLRKLEMEGALSGQQKELLVNAEAEYKAYSAIAAEQQQQLVATVREVIDAYRAKVKKMYLGGAPMIASDMVSFVKSDLKIFGIGILIFILILLSVIFRQIRWVLLPLLACLMTNAIMLGVLGWLDWRMTVISSNFIALLLIITLAIAVHLVVRYRELEALNTTWSRHELARETVSQMVRPCVYTALTTVIAFMSLVISGIRPIIDFGWMMTVGVLVALTLTFLIVPIGMRIGKKSEMVKEAVRKADEAVFTQKFAFITERYGIWVLLIAILLSVFAVTGITQLKVENRFIDYFDDETEIYRGMELIDSKLGGTIPLEVILFSSAMESVDDFMDEEFEDDFADEFEESFEDEFGDDFSEETEAVSSEWFTRAGLEKIAEIHRHLESLPEAGKVLSLATFYDVTKDLLGGSVDDIQLSLALNSLPDNIKSTMITPYLNLEADEVRINVRVKETSRTLNRNQFLQQLDLYIQEEIGLDSEQYRLTGMLVLYNNMLQSLFSSQIMTLGAVFVAITIMLTILFRSIVLAIIGIIPNVLAALLVLGGMGWAGLPLDMMTITIAAISIGIGVDNTIHYIHRFKTEFPKDRVYVASMYRSHGSIGRAMYYTSITIIFGFSILALSNFKPSIYFGLLTAGAMLSALLGSLLLLPKLLLMIKPLGAEAS